MPFWNLSIFICSSLSVSPVSLFKTRPTISCSPELYNCSISANFSETSLATYDFNMTFSGNVLVFRDIRFFQCPVLVGSISKNPSSVLYLPLVWYMAYCDLNSVFLLPGRRRTLVHNSAGRRVGVYGFHTCCHVH